MNKEQILKELKSKIIKYVPDIIRNENAQIIHLDHSVEYFTEYRPITLEDVLIAGGKEIHDNFDFHLGVGILTIYSDSFDIDWELNKPLHEQKLETLELLNKVL